MFRREQPNVLFFAEVIQDGDKFNWSKFGVLVEVWLLGMDEDNDATAGTWTRDSLLPRKAL